MTKQRPYHLLSKQALIEYLATFENMHLTGRTALYRYLHLHDLLQTGKALVEQIAGTQLPADTATLGERCGTEPRLDFNV